jgi:hypothetical protein
MSIQEDAKWPPERVDDDQLDDSELAKEQRELVDDPTRAPQAGLESAPSGDGEGGDSGQSGDGGS